MYAKLIDNKRKSLKDTLSQIIESKQYKHLSIATGYWDLPGMIDIIDGLSNYESIRLLIGQEPLPNRLITKLSDIENEENSLFPDDNIAFDLVKTNQESNNETSLALRETAKKLIKLIEKEILEVKVFRSPRLHAKAYIFGDKDSQVAVGIIGSSNFTKAGLEKNAELNYVEEDPRVVLYSPANIEQEHGHLSWFNELWEDEEAQLWSGDFSNIVEMSPLGDMTYGPYDVYIKTLMEVFPDELLPKKELSQELKDVLYSFQDRNAGILLNKLHKYGVAMLSDSVGLGKTITAGAVIKNYKEAGAKRIMVIAPASLLNQWKRDLGAVHNISPDEIEYLSMQNVQEQQNKIDELEKPYTREVELFVIDEAHNLRNPNSSRYESILELLEACPDAPVLLLTATPVNNSLIDLANQIQLAMRGSLESVPVSYFNSDGKSEVIDFFEVLKRVQSEIAKAERAGEKFEWDRHEGSLRAGIRQYLVRSTRQAVEAQGSLVLGGEVKHFPKTKVSQLPYWYKENILANLTKIVSDAIDEKFEGVDPLRLNLDISSKVTQQSMHPLDLFKPAFVNDPQPRALDLLNEEEYAQLFVQYRSSTLIPSIFQVINLLGFTPYRPEVYRTMFYGKSQEDIRNLNLKENVQRKINTQRIIHNMLQITWLKRLESSAAALMKSVMYYKKRLDLFESYLNKGFIIPLGDIDDLESEYGEDLERAFTDYEEAYNEIQKALSEERDISDLKLKGVERIEATPKEFFLDELKRDLQRDKAILSVLEELLFMVQTPENNAKLQSFVEHVSKVVELGNNGKKVLIFSFFADTVEYLQENLPVLMKENQDFLNRAGFISGSNRTKVENFASRFSPESKKYDLKEGESEIDFLFATDVLSEGQNLQDAGILINYDLHWNPVRMIQRNGRINRLGSKFDEVQIINMKPHDDLEAYLKLLRRLERKIDTIKNSIGTDQSILGEKENPIEFVDFFSDDSIKASTAAAAAEENLQSGGIFSQDDDFQFDLRRFLADHPEGDPARIRVESMPKGKWNYLPKRDNLEDDVNAERKGKPLDKDEFLVLDKIEGHGAITNEKFETTLFLKVRATGKYYEADPIEEIDALSLIKTIPSDNEPLRDVVPATFSRDKIARRAAGIAKIKTESAEYRKDLKPKQQEAVKIMAEHYSKDIDLLGIVTKGIKLAQDEREFKRLVRLINKEAKEDGVVKSSTVTRFENLIKRLQTQTSEQQHADKVENILFYAQG